jgi:protocatechuate 3,4-dioxygenase beta subunit
MRMSVSGSTTEGPYYVTGTARLTAGNLNYAGLPGDPITIVGHVYSGDNTSKPIAGAKVEIWQADSHGRYHPEGNGAASKYDAGEIALRGYVLADGSGAYAFATIYPGHYRGRTRHIHVRASAEDYGSVTTQIIVPSRPGDGTTPESDFIARFLPPANFVTFSEENGVQTASFDFFIPPGAYLSPIAAAFPL